MICGIYSVKDNKRGYWPLQIEYNDAVALRNYRFMCSKEENIPNFSPSDFELYKLGEFDDQTGEIILCEKEIVVE